MATFRDLVGKLESGKAHKLYWLCGNQGVLIEEAVTAIRLTIDAEEMNTVTLFAGQDTPAAIWTEMSQHAIDPTMPRVVTVRNAEKLGKGLAKLEPWIAGTKYANVHVIMVSNQEEWKSDYMPDVRKKVVGSTTSLYVECKLSKTPGGPQDPKDEQTRPYSKGEQQAAQIIAELWCPHISIDLALHLARRTGCDMARCRDVSMWINCLDGKFKPSKKGIDALAVSSPTEGFADALTRLDKAGAMEHALLLDDHEVRSALIRLQRNLSDLEAINRAMRPVLQRINDRTKVAMAITETARAANVSFPNAARLWDHARHYDAPSVSRRVEALIRADVHRNEQGVLETLVTEW